MKVVLVLWLFGCAACAGDAMPEPPSLVLDEKLRTDLRQLSERRVFFGHQSVGENLVKGLEELAAATHQPLTISRGPGFDVPPGTLRHEKVGENREPLRKLSEFDRALGEQTSADVALLKFCYVDVEPATDAAALFEAYESTLAQLEAKHPHTTFVRSTVPLRTFERGAKASLKRLLGRDTGERANENRERFNALVREAAARAKAPLFDIARVESTWPDGTLERTVWNQKGVPGVVPSYTDDGGHLNRPGRQRAARELAAVLAAAPVRGLAAEAR